MKTRARGKKPTRTKATGNTIQLVNPMSGHFGAFVIGAAATWQVRALIESRGVLSDEDHRALHEAVMASPVGMAYGNKVVHDLLGDFANQYVAEEGSAKGQTLVICGAGPSLREHADEYCAKADQVWGCNSALTWLHDNGYKVTHGFTVDQTAHMAQEWASTPDVEYLIASTVHPDLTELLVAKERRFRFFHNFVGLKGEEVPIVDDDGNVQTLSFEDWCYVTLFPRTTRAGSGLNTVTRAIDVASYMGFEEIYVLGADCALRYDTETIPLYRPGSPEYMDWLRNHTEMHADGGHALASEATPTTLRGVIDGRLWLTKPDMAISAQWLVKMAQKSGGKLKLIGDTLPNALKDKPDSFLHRLPNFVDAEGNLANLPV